MMRGTAMAILVAAAATLAGATGLTAQEATARATLLDAAGREVGTATFTQTPNRGVLIRLEVQGLAPGRHGLHIHETGACTPPDFADAGGHFAPRGNAHGVLHPHGAHAGDLLNLNVPASGRIVTERLAPGVTLVAGAHGSLHDDNGAALVIHATADDYRSQPAGDGGPRVACGVIR